jgi:hypothetical protein
MGAGMLAIAMCGTMAGAPFDRRASMATIEPAPSAPATPATMRRVSPTVLTCPKRSTSRPPLIAVKFGKRQRWPTS